MSASPYIELDGRSLFWVRQYCDRGLRVVPLHRPTPDGGCTCSRGKACTSQGKHPKDNGWTKKASNDYVKMAPLFEGDCNVGIATGKGIVVLDADGQDGRDSLAQLSEEFGGFPPGPMAETGSGGLHLFFKCDESFTNRVKFLPGLDVRGDGGQVVSAPSLHRSGRCYAWLNNSFELTFPSIPEWLAGLIRGDRRTDWDAASWLAQQNPSIQGENGSARLMSVTGAMTRNGIRNETEYLRLIAPWNARCVPPWSEGELVRGFRNAMKTLGEGAVIALPLGKGGKVVCSRAHLDQIVREDPKYEFQFSQDIRAGVTLYAGNPIMDQDISDIEVEICGRYHIQDINKPKLTDSILRIARMTSFDPVLRYLESLQWDGEERLVHVPSTILHCADRALHASFFKRWAIGTARRALEPGCQMDTVLCIQGDQGALKSSFFRALGDPWFSDTKFNMEDKDGMMSIQGAWIMEWSELNSIKRFENETIKAFLTSRIDKYRPPYARFPIERPRAGVIVGTTNRRDFLSDPTGSRRFWILEMPIKCEKIDLAAVRAQRDQLWAEAYHLAKAGEPHWLSAEEESARAEINERFQADDPVYWTVRNEIEYGPDQFSWNILTANLGLGSTLPHGVLMSVQRAVRDCGFEPALRRVDGKQKRFWCRSPKTDRPL